MTSPPRHASCYHVGYSLSCSEYDDLLRAADGRCQICATPTVPLYIDHDHSLGDWAVRGLVCHRCNQALRHVDSKSKLPSVETSAYLSNAWHHRQSNSPAKALRVRRKVKCPACGKPTAVHKNGNLARHWSRLPGRHDVLCLGVQQPADA